MLKNDHMVLFMLTELGQNNNSISFMTEAFTSNASFEKKNAQTRPVPRAGPQHQNAQAMGTLTNL